MKSYMIGMVIISFVFSGSLLAQEGVKKKKELQKKAGEERTRSVKGYRTESELLDDKGKVPQSNAEDMADGEEDKGENKTRAHGRTQDTLQTRTNAPTSQVIEPNDDQPQSQDARRSNTPAVIQMTPSESGSAAVPAPNNGHHRDGTNTIQRSKPNMAGAKEPGNMNLSEKDNSQRNIHQPNNVREQQEQPAKIEADGVEVQGKSVKAPAQKPTTGANQRKQTVPVQETVAPAADSDGEESRKEKRAKRKKNRKKDSDGK